MKPFYRLVRDVVHVLFRLYGRVQVIGHDRIPPSGPVIIASNHVSYLDPPLIGSSMRRECAYLAQSGLWKKAWFGRIIAALNSIPVDRDRPDRSTIRRVLDVLASGMPVVLFPEGTRSHDGRLHEGAPGVALFVMKSGAPVVPTAVIGPERMWPPGQKRLRRVPLKVVFGDPLFFTPDTPRDEVVQGIMRAIGRLLVEYGRPEAVEGGPLPVPQSRSRPAIR